MASALRYIELFYTLICPNNSFRGLFRYFLFCRKVWNVYEWLFERFHAFGQRKFVFVLFCNMRESGNIVCRLFKVIVFYKHYVKRASYMTMRGIYLCWRSFVTWAVVCVFYMGSHHLAVFDSLCWVHTRWRWNIFVLERLGNIYIFLRRYLTLQPFRAGGRYPTVLCFCLFFFILVLKTSIELMMHGDCKSCTLLMLHPIHQISLRELEMLKLYQVRCLLLN